MLFRFIRYVVGGGLPGGTGPGGGSPDGPTLSNLVAVEDGASGFSATVDTDEDTGSLFFVVTTSASAPSAAQIKNGQDHLGQLAAFDGEQLVNATGEQEIAAASGLLAATTYWLHVIHTDEDDDDSNILTSASFTTDEQADDYTATMLFAGIY